MNDKLDVGMFEIEGKVKIEKFDENGERTFVEEGKNVVKQWVYNNMKKKMASAVCAWNPSQPIDNSWEAWNPVRYFRFVYLLNSNDIGMQSVTPGLNTEPCFPLKSGTWTAYCDKYNQTIGSDTKIGIVKYQESYCTPNSAVFVYEWSPTKGDGAFDTIIHSDNDDSQINNADNQNWGTSDTGFNVPAGPNNAIWKNNRPYVWTIYKNSSNQLVVCHTPTLDGVNLKYTEYNLTTGVSTVIVIDTWNNALSGTTPNYMAVNYNASTGDKTFVFTILNSGSQLHVIMKYSGGAWTKTDGPTIDNYKGMWIDNNYLYVKGYFNTLNRYTHAGVASGSINVGDIYAFMYNNKIYNANYGSYYDITNATWTGETIPETRHKECYPDINSEAPRIVDGVFYRFESFRAYITGESSSSESTTYSLVGYQLGQYKQIESAHYKGSLINKSSNETLKITYTFTF